MHGRQGLHPLVVSCPWNQMSAIDTKPANKIASVPSTPWYLLNMSRPGVMVPGTASRTRRTGVQLRVGPRGLSPEQSLFLSHSVVIPLRRQRKDPDVHSINFWEKVTRVVGGRGRGERLASHFITSALTLQRTELSATDLKTPTNIKFLQLCRIAGRLLTPQIWQLSNFMRGTALHGFTMVPFPMTLHFYENIANAS